MSRNAAETLPRAHRPDPETEIGGDGRWFPSTSWTLLLAARGGEARCCLDRLIGLYWKPVYWFIRIRWRKPNEEAKDLTQEFFATFLAKDWLATYRAEKARFRTYVRVALTRFLCASARDGSRLKRGGGAGALSIDMARACDIDPPAEGLRPDEAFDRAWREGLVRDALASLAETYRSCGREAWYVVFKRHDLAEGDPPTYEETARALEISVSDVQKRLRHVRSALRELIRQRVRETLGDPRDLEDELSSLFGGR